MKALLLLLMFSVAITAVAQWNTNSTHIYSSNSGNVGIGNTTPTYKLDVSGNLRTTDFISAQQYIAVNYGSSYVVALNGQGDGYISGRNSSYQEKFAITSNGSSYFNGGNVGIGLSSPSAKMHLQQSAGGWADGLRLTLAGKNWDVVSDSNGDRLIIAPNQDLSKGVVINNGSFGIGIANPWSKLQVYHSSSQPYSNAAYIQSNNAAEHWPLVVNSNSNNFSGFFSNSVQDMSLILRDKNGNGALLQSLGSSYLNGGNFGVGTASPNAKVAIQNTSAYNFNEAAAGQDHILFSGTDPGNGGFFGGLTWESGGRRRASIAATREHTDSDYVGLAFFTRGVDGPGPMAESMRITRDGNVGIGTTTPDATLAVKGNIHTQEVKVDLTGAVAPDYVFEKDYDLLSLSEIETYINQHKHLPEVPSAKKMEEEGLNLKEMNLILLKKVEELTLHLIEIKKENDVLKKGVAEVELLKKEIQSIQQMLK